MADPDSVAIVTNLISTVGFPIFVAVWMLFKGSKDSAQLKDAINELTLAVKLIQGSNKKKGDE